MNKNVKKIICGALAAVSAFGCAATLTACETSRPEVEMVIEFNGSSYTLRYEMARNVTPATVNHFIWLVDNGYYNGLCVHNYEEDAKMYTGGYKTATEEGDTDGLTEFSYYNEIAKFSNYSAFPHSVWLDSEKKTPTYTLYGEFENNNVEVENGKIADKFGSLSMYYYDTNKYEASKTDVWGARQADKLFKRTYEYNSATSLFYINMDEETSSFNKKYCTFASLKSESVEVLKDLKEEIESIDDITHAHSVRVCENDPVLGEYEIKVSFNVPQKEIKIKTVKITKY
jgi:cyclophilin family peptidyl-prolyl cis-trans isomerase